MAEHEVYVDTAALAAVLGGIQGQDARLKHACVLASRWIDQKMMRDLSSELLWDPGDTIKLVPQPAALAGACQQLAVRLYRSPDVVLGVAGGMGDLAVRVSRVSVQDLELMLLGYREQWGVA